MPAALHEVGTALVVAVTVLPQLAESVRRVRAAQALRAGDTRRWGRLRRFLVPVLEDALERSLRLAAGMDTRGYGRSAGATREPAAAHRGLMLGRAAAGSASGCTPSSTAPLRGVLAAPMLVRRAWLPRRRAGHGRPPRRPHAATGRTRGDGPSSS